MKTDDIEKSQGHWILAKMGKKVLRPGGKELTLSMVHSLSISPKDDVTEFAPGLGFTASVVLQNNPKSYTGVELDADAANVLKKRINGANKKIIVGSAAHTPLCDESSDKVFGEAMLTMQADHRKSEIIKEAHRILKKGGLYGIHELGLMPDALDEKTKTVIQKDLALAIKVNARPLTEAEWKALLEKEGFVIKKVITNSMSLLEPKRIIDDEGFFRTLKIAFNILTNPKARKRILEMRRIFTKHHKHINAIAIVAQKN